MYTFVIITIILIFISLTSLTVFILSKNEKNRIFALEKGILYSIICLSIMIFYSLFYDSNIDYFVKGLLVILLIAFYLNVRFYIKRKCSEVNNIENSPRKFYITGDKHRNFENVKKFCIKNQTRKKDVLIILGDAGFNYFGDSRDEKLKSQISKLNITLFCLHGNKENRPQNICTYGIQSFCGGKVYYEPKYPGILFAIDGEIYTINGKNFLVIGGAHSVDKNRCLEENLPYWEDETPDAETQDKIEKILESQEHKIFGLLTHTCPIKYLPTEMFISTRERKTKSSKKRFTKPKKQYELDIDRSMEQWLDEIEESVTYSVWFCGHYHIDKQIDKLIMLKNQITSIESFWNE